MQKGDVHRPALSKKAIPTCSSREVVARRRGTENNALCFSHGFQAEKASERTLAVYPPPP